MDPRKITGALARRASWYIVLKVILSLFILVYAVGITATTTVYHAETGGAIQVTNNLKAMDKGLSKAVSGLSSAGTTCASNVTFTGSAQNATNGITPNHIVYTVQVNTTSAAVANTCFTVSLTITPNGGSQQTYAVYLATGNSPIPDDQTIDCKFDIGTSLPTSPYSFRVTVQ